jgi:alcohol dehydrogenase class IV
MFPAPHGAVCAAILPHAMEVNIQALRRRAPASDGLRRYQEVACLLTGNAHATADDGVLWISDLCRRLRIPPLREYGVGAGDLDVLAEKAAKASSMKANPIVLTREELHEIIVRAV